MVVVLAILGAWLLLSVVVTVVFAMLLRGGRRPERVLEDDRI